ncbi:MAG TPA: response regulator transcription factor, partial [Ktedonobacterales bacterium]|nr:response regulator transcription factor [Ktedonobacterales bacterium]
MVCVLLADDETVVRRGLRTRFQLEPDIQVVGEASTGAEALALAQTLLPDVVLMDVQMPDMDGIAATAALRRLALRRLAPRRLAPQTAVVMLTIHDDAQARARAQAAGAAAFVEKRGDPDALMAAIREAAEPEIDTLPGYIRELLGVRVWHPTTFAPEGPARPDWTWHAAPGKLALQANRNPVQAHGTPSKVRCCFYPQERCTAERPNSMQVARCRMSSPP